MKPFIILAFLLLLTPTPGWAADLATFPAAPLTVILLLISVGVYVLPSIVAWSGLHHHLAAIFWLNLFLGWTVIGWVIACVWAWKTAPAPVKII